MIRPTALVLVVFLAACAAPEPVPAPDPVPATREDAVGEQLFGYLERDGAMLTLATATLLTGEEAARAARRDGRDEDGTVPNDYYIDRSDSRRRTFTLVADAVVRELRGGSAEPVPVEAGEWTPDPGRPYWLTVEQGEVVAVQAQYLP